MSTPFMQVKIANVTLRVPVCGDEKTTRAIAEKVSERFLAIEETSDRVDTQAFALRTAFDLAAEFYAHLEAQKQDTRDLLVMLDTISTRLGEILTSHQDD